MVYGIGAVKRVMERLSMLLSRAISQSTTHETKLFGAGQIPNSHTNQDNPERGINDTDLQNRAFYI